MIGMRNSISAVISSVAGRVGTNFSTARAASGIGPASIMRAAAITGFAAATIVTAFGCGRGLLDGVLEDKPEVTTNGVGGSAGFSGSAGMGGTAGVAGDAGLDADAAEDVINPDVFDAAEADAIINPDVFDAAEADVIINPDVIEAEAGDADANPPIDADGAVCTPLNFTYNSFGPATGIYTNTVAVSGAIQLQEDDTKWTGIYDASFGFLPDDNNTLPKWTKTGSFIAPSPDVSTGSLYLNTLGSNGAGYYSINTNFDNSIGYAIDINLKINGEDEATSPDTKGFFIEFADGSKRAVLSFYIDRICEQMFPKNCYQFTTSAYHVFRIMAKGFDYKVFVDNNLALDASGYLTSGAGGLNYIWIGDGDLNPDSSANIKYIKWHNLGNYPPYKNTGTYQHGSTSDSTFDNFDWTGIFAGWTNTGAGTASLAIRTGNTPADLSAASFSSEFNTPGAIPSGFTGKLLEWRLTENSNPDTPVVPEVSFKKDCADQ